MLHIRRWAALTLAVLAALMCAVSAHAATPEDYNKNMPQLLREDHLYAQTAVLMDADTGEVLLNKNARVRMYPASTTKVMTCLLALESGIAMDTVISIPQQAAQIPSDSSLVPVFPGDQMTFRDLLYGFMLSSGNDGANAVAVLVSGSVEAFVDRMNQRAEELGCIGTHFANPHGYHNDQHYTTAYDMALITREAIKSQTFRGIVSTNSYTLNIRRNGSAVETRVLNTNQLIKKDSSYYYADCIGVKTGFHSKAGQCFVGAAERDGVRLIAVDFNCAQSIDRWRDCIRMFNFGFTQYTPYSLDQMFNYASAQIATIKISNAAETDPGNGNLDLKVAQISNPDYVRMVQSDSEHALQDAVDDFVSRTELTITGDMVAPVSEGEIMGRFRYVALTGETITGLLVASRDIAEQPAKLSITDVLPFLKSFENPLVRALSLVLVALVLLLILSGIVSRRRRERQRSRIYEVRLEEYREAKKMEQRRRAEVRKRSAASRRAARRPRNRRPDDYDPYDDDIFDE